jgi:hypothetical protein
VSRREFRIVFWTRNSSSRVDRKAGPSIVDVVPFDAMFVAWPQRVAAEIGRRRLKQARQKQAPERQSNRAIRRLADDNWRPVSNRWTRTRWALWHRLGGGRDRDRQMRGFGPQPQQPMWEKRTLLRGWMRKTMLELKEGQHMAWLRIPCWRSRVDEMQPGRNCPVAGLERASVKWGCVALS